jgi:DNA-directed RNA polymerase specialized sigma24 family protein
MTFITRFNDEDGKLNFRELIEALGLYQYVFRIVFRRGGVLNLEDAEDVTQDILLLIFRSIDQFKGKTKGEFLAWVGIIAIHLVTRAINKAKRKPRAITEELAIDNLEAPLLSDPAQLAVVRSELEATRAGVVDAHERLKSRFPGTCLDMEQAGLPMGPRKSLTVVAKECSKSRAALFMAWARYREGMEAELLEMGYDKDQRAVACLIMEFGGEDSFFLDNFDFVSKESLG